MTITHVTHRQASIMLTLIWVDLIEQRDQKLSEETIKMLGLHFAPHFTASREPDDKVRYILHMPADPERSTVDQVYAISEPPDESNKHLRLDMNSPAVRGFMETARNILLRELREEFPLMVPESSFAYIANRLITSEEPDDEDHPPSSS